MKKNSLLLLAWLGILVPLASFAISSPTWFTPTQVAQDAFLQWQNPTDTDFTHVEIRRSSSTYPNTINDGDFVTSGTNTSYADNGASDGMQYYSIFALDLSGNTSTPTTWSIDMDLTDPVFSAPWLTGVVLGSGWIVAQREVSDPSGITTFRYQIMAYNSTWASLIDYTINNISQTVYTGSLWLDQAFIDAGGTGWDYIFQYTATDIYGNETVRQLSFTYDPQYLADTTGPVVSDLLPSSGQIVPGNIPFSWTVSDPTLPGWYIAFRIAGDVGLTQLAYQAGVFVTDFNTTQTLTGTVSLPEGSYYRWSTVFDYLGNQTTTPSTPFTVDTTAPILTYTSPIADGWSIIFGETASLTVEAYDVHLDGGHIHTYVGTTANFDQTRPTNGLYHGGNSPFYSTSQGSLSLSNLPVGTYYWYAEANDVAGNYTSWAMQSFTVRNPRSGWGWGGSASNSRESDVCTSTDLSPSDYDGLCFDSNGTPVSHREKIIKLLNPNATPSDTGNYVTVAGFIRDVFALLDIPFRGTMPESYSNTPVPEKLFAKVVKKLEKLYK